MKKVAVILSGCGGFDGAEIHESVLALHAIEKQGASWHCFAPNVQQMHVINHLTGEEMPETRNVLVESARIARGKIQDVATLNVNEFDALLLPGGFGAAKNLTDFAVKGAQCSINPTIIPMIYGEAAQGTIGNDHGTAAAFNQLGGQHVDCPVEGIVFDERHKVLSTPAYMLAENISQAASGIEKLVERLLQLA